MRQAPIVSGVALLSLALGIGANVAIFSLVNALILKPLPVHEPDRLVIIGFQGIRGPNTSLTNPQWEYIRDHQDTLVGVGAYGNPRFNLNSGGETRNAQGLFVSGRFFDTLGGTPHIGRLFTPDDDKRGGGPDGAVAVLSYGFWQREYGGRADVIGKSIQLDGHPFTIIGVSQRDFRGLQIGRAFDIAAPLGTEPIVRGRESSLDRRSNWWLTVFGRLAPGQTQEQAQARLRDFLPQVREATLPLDWPASELKEYLSEPFTLIAGGTGVSNLRERYSQPLYVLLGIVGLVLTIACANVANLLLAQSVARRKELAVRLSLGAGRWRLVRQLLVESIMLSAIGGSVGVILAWLAGVVLSKFLFPTYLSITAVIVAVTVSGAIGVVSGIWPAKRAAWLDPIPRLLCRRFRPPLGRRAPFRTQRRRSRDTGRREWVDLALHPLFPVGRRSSPRWMTVMIPAPVLQLQPVIQSALPPPPLLHLYPSLPPQLQFVSAALLLLPQHQPMAPARVPQQIQHRRPRAE
jgi:predicted permease